MIISFRADTKTALLLSEPIVLQNTKDIRLNCSHFCVYDFPSSNERGLISRELGVDKDKYIKATKEPFSFLYVDKPMKRINRNFYGTI